jgi:hypothetical protein
MYGDDGIDVMENKFLDRFKFLEHNHTVMQRKVRHLIKSGAVEIEPVKKIKQKSDRDPLLSIFHP